MIRTILTQVKSFKKASWLAPLWVSLEVLLEVLIPFLLSILIDQGIEKGSLPTIYFYAGLMLVAAFVSLYAGIQSGRYASIASSGLARNLRQAQYEQIQAFGFQEIDHFSTPSLITRMSTDVVNVQNAYMMLIRACVRSPLMLVASLILSFLINPSIGLLFIGMTVFLGIGLFLIIGIVRPIFMRLFRQYDALNARVQENITGIRVVKSFVREPYEIDHFNDRAQQLFLTQRKAEQILAFNGPLIQFSAYFCLVAIAWIGAHLIVQHQLTTGELMSLLAYIMSILMSLMMLSMVFVMVSMSIASAQRIHEVLSCQPAMKDGQLDEPAQNGQLEFKNVSFAYFQDKVLDHINLTIQSGQTIGLVGPTGSAKSSLVSLIARLYDPTEGKILLGGRDLKDYRINRLRHEVSIILQKNTLFSGTIVDNLRWAKPDASLEEIKEACRIANASEFIEALDKQYDSWVQRGGANFSGGQRQRLCIARALLRHPKVMILDDSTSAVDTKTDASIRQALKTNLADTTTIIIAQRISSVMDADQIIVLEDGHVTGLGTHEQLLQSNEYYAQTYAAQTKGDQHENQSSVSLA